MRPFFAVPAVALAIALTVAPAMTATTATTASDDADEAAESAAGALDAALARDWQFRLDDDPFLADSVGDRRGADRLREVGVAAEKRRADHDRAMRERVAAVDPEALGAADRLDRELFLRLLDERRAAADRGDWMRPLTARDGFHLEFAALPDVTRFDRVLDYRRYISRLLAFRRHVGQQIEAMREGMRRGALPPRDALDGWEAALRPHRVDAPEESPLWAPFVELPDRFRPALQDFLRGLARDAIRESVLAGYADLETFLREEYAPALRPHRAAPERYAERLRFAAGRGSRAETVNARALEALERARAALGGPEASGDEAERRPAGAGEGAAALDDLARALKRVDGALPLRHGRLPRTPYGLRALAGARVAGAEALGYRPPAADGARAGFLEVQPAAAAALGTERARLEAYRLAVPGRHLQTALALENAALRPFRRHARFPAFVEGWAVYAADAAPEDLALPAAPVDVGERDRLQRARLALRARVAALAAADTGLHGLGWSRERAVALLVEQAGETPDRAARAIDRVLGHPTEAAAAFVGAEALRALRAEVEEARRAEFDARRFHDAVLGQGALPLDRLPGEAWRSLGKR